MKIKYLKNGKVFTNIDTCKDFEIEASQKKGKRTVTLIAKTDLELVNAIELLPIPTTTKDRYFLNGYQSWTDTKEFKLADRLRDIKKSPHIISHLYAMHAYSYTVLEVGLFKSMRRF